MNLNTTAPDFPRFRLGRLCVTPGALATLASLSLSPWSFLSRHQHGDWGDLDADDRRANTLAVIQGSRVFSAYDLGHHQSLWIITEADRSVTTLLLPEEY